MRTTTFSSSRPTCSYRPEMVTCPPSKSRTSPATRHRACEPVAGRRGAHESGSRAGDAAAAESGAARTLGRRHVHHRLLDAAVGLEQHARHGVVLDRHELGDVLGLHCEEEAAKKTVAPMGRSSAPVGWLASRCRGGHATSTARCAGWQAKELVVSANACWCGVFSTALGGSCSRIIPRPLEMAMAALCTLPKTFLLS